MATQMTSIAGPKTFKIHNHQWPSFTAYRSLNPTSREIRLLTITGYSSNNIIQCSLQHVTLDSKPHYHALSYYWGAPVSQKDLLPILVDGSTVYVRPTMSAFLHCLYAQAGDVTVWLDAICINQDDIEERNQQVSMMGDIFAKATGIYSWLGDANADTDYAFDALNGNLVTGEVNSIILSQYIEDILLRPYWTRQWVIQEFIMAQTIVLVCGRKSLSWAIFDQHIRNSPRQEFAEYWKRYQRFEQGRRNYHEAIVTPYDWGEKALYQLMSNYQTCRCTDHRDKVYALLGLSSESSLVSADYSISTADLFYKILSLHPPLTKFAICEHNAKQSGEEACEPLEAASRILKGFAISTLDLIGHLAADEEDRLYAWFCLVGQIHSVYKESANDTKRNPFIPTLRTRATGLKPNRYTMFEPQMLNR